MQNTAKRNIVVIAKQYTTNEKRQKRVKATLSDAGRILTLPACRSYAQQDSEANERYSWNACGTTKPSDLDSLAGDCTSSWGCLEDEVALVLALDPAKLPADYWITADEDRDDDSAWCDAYGRYFGSSVPHNLRLVAEGSPEVAGSTHVTSAEIAEFSKTAKRLQKRAIDADRELETS